MKYLFSFLLTSALLFCHHSSNCQVSKDSLWARSVKAIQKRVQLSDSITTILLEIGNDQIRETHELNSKKTLQVEDRGNALKQIQQQYHRRVKNILTADQWNQYLELEDNMRDRSIKSLQDRKIPYKELGS